ncbi:MAG TPA: ribulose-phosphate 3-epimerase [Steroidobacteraceae bacterium]|nr:ribulose-phosphate 3-epimerase [Steroidobacteraceae bacterium]
MMDPVIAPSILSADFARLGEEAQAVLRDGADWIHFDVMDNHYVPNLTIGPLVCEALRKAGIVAPIDVHLMVSPVDRLVPEFAKAGATYISFHPEATGHPDRTIRLIRDSGCKPGLALNPATALEWLDYVIDELDLILIMSVNPGFAGQTFIATALAKLTAARRRIVQSGRPIRLEIDGGVKLGNAAEIARAGADTFVAGSAIFGSGDYAATIAALRREIEAGRRSGG